MSHELCYVLYAVGGAVLGWLAKRFGLKLPTLPPAQPGPSPVGPGTAPAGPQTVDPARFSPEVLSLALALQEAFERRARAAKVEQATAMLAELGPSVS